MRVRFLTLASLRESYPIPKRHDAERVLTELHEKRLELEASLPRVDRRVTREAEDQFQAAEAEWAKHSSRRQEREDQERSWTTRIRNKRPPQTRRLVVAQLETGDEIDDVRSPTRTILIGWLKHSDSPFREMRKAALRIPEVAALLAAPPWRVEHVDTTTVGT